MGYIKRWNQHCYEAKAYKNCSRLLDNSIRKFGKESFKVELLKVCKIEELNYYEQYYISLYNSMVPNGYNLTSGGTKNSEETSHKKMIGKNKGKVLEKRKRIREKDSILPKYITSYYDSSGKQGYRIRNHPFISKNEKLLLALDYLNKQEGSTTKRRLGTNVP